MENKIEHKDLKLLSEANNITLLQSTSTGKIYAVVKRNSGFFGDEFNLQELKS